MGAAAGAGGSDSSDERKVDTYAQQYQTLVQKKNKTGRYKNNSKIPSTVGIISQALKDPIDNLNLNKRMNFANKNNINLQGLSTDQILSKDFKSQLDAKGYTRETPTGNNNGGGNDNTPRPTILKKTAGGQTVQTTAPTEAEVSQSAAADAEAYDLRKTKKRGRSMTTLISSKGVTDNKLTLGKPSLLGA
jgi:hypothetical protein